MAGGIGRFAAGRKKPAQQQQNNTSGNNDGGGGGEQQPNVNNNNGATANTTNNTDPTTNTTNNNMEVERPSTAFNSFNSINNADADRPATSGSHGFSAINNMMFGGVDNDGMMMMDDNTGVGNFDLDNNSTTATEFGQGFSQSFDPMAAAEAAFQDFGGFNTTATENNNSGVEGKGDEHQPAIEMGKGTDGNGNEKNIEQPVVAEKQPAIAPVQEQQPKSNVGVGVGGGVGRFAKKRIVNTTTTTAKSSSSTQQSSALAVLANAATETATLMSNTDKFSPIRNTTTNTATAVMNKSVVENNNSSSDLSRFDIDLMSKNTDNAVGKRNGDDEGVMNVEGVENKEAAVPTSIRTSGDDVEDDLTEATATTFDGDIFHEAKADDTAVGEKESSKTSPYFANVATNNQVVEKQNEENVGTTTKTTSPIEDAVKDVDNQGKPPPKLGGNNVMNVQPPAQTAVQAIPTNTSGANENKGPSGAPRVSLSPRPSGANVTMNQGGDNVSSLSPKGPSSRPSQNTKQANTFKGNDDDDNSIVIPGISAAVANNPDFSQQANVVARLSNTINNVRQPGSQMNNSSTRSFQPPSSSSAKGRMITATLQKPVLNRQKKQPPFMMNRNTMTTSNSCDIVTEKVTFALPKTRPTAAANNSNDMNMMMNSNQKNGTSLAQAAAAAGSTAITPDSRGVANNNQVAAAATPFGRQSDTSSGSESSSGDDLSPHKDHTFVPTSTTAQPPKKTMEQILPPPQQQQRPRSQTITSPPEALLTAPAQSETPKVSNVNPPSSATMAATSSYHHNNNAAFHTDETFDELLSQFVKDIQDGTDIYEKGQNDLLGLNVEVTHAYSKLLRYKDEYKELLADIEGVQAMAESVMAEISVE